MYFFAENDGDAEGLRGASARLSDPWPPSPSGSHYTKHLGNEWDSITQIYNIMRHYV